MWDCRASAFAEAVQRTYKYVRSAAMRGGHLLKLPALGRDHVPRPLRLLYIPYAWAQSALDPDPMRTCPYLQLARRVADRTGSGRRGRTAGDGLTDRHQRPPKPAACHLLLAPAEAFLRIYIQYS